MDLKVEMKMKITYTTVIKALTCTALLSTNPVQAAMVQFSLDGAITSATNPNIFNVAVNDIVTVTGLFDDNIIGSGLTVVDFSTSYNNMLISIGNTDFTDAMDVFGGANMYFVDGAFDGIDYAAIDTSFDSWGVIGGIPGFEDFTGNGIAGNWNAGSFQTVSAVPVPAAIWLFGSGLALLAGFSRRNKQLRYL